MVSHSDPEKALAHYQKSRALAVEGSWQDSLVALRNARKILPQNEDLRELESEILVRLGHREEARFLLEGLSERELTQEESWRKTWLSNPPLAAQKTEKTVLHPLYDTRRIDSVKLHVVGHLEPQILEELKSFHQRELPGPSLTISGSESPPELPSFEQLRAQLEVGSEPEWLRNLAVDDTQVLVVLQATEATAYSVGFGAPGIAVVGLIPGDPFQATVVAHELYHSLLDLNHTNGTEGPLDLSSLMGPFGLRTPLSHTHLSQEHKALCLTTEEAQSLVESLRYEEALLRDPDYVALYRPLAETYLRQREPQRALEVLKRWFERDPGPESASLLTRWMLDLGLDPTPYFLRTRGHGEAANTHLYLAQACLDSFCFEQAITELERAGALEPDNLSLRGMLGWAHHGNGEFDIARALYTEALAACPSWEAVYARLAWLEGTPYRAAHPDPDLLWLQSLREEPEVVVALLEGQSDQRCLLRRARAWVSLKNLPEARKLFTACVEQNPYTHTARVSEAWLLYLDGSPQVEKALQLASAVWPRNPCLQALVRIFTE